MGEDIMISNGAYTLRSMVPEDLEFARELRNNSQVNGYLSSTEYLTKEQQLEWYCNKYAKAADEQRFVLLRDQVNAGLFSLTEIRLNAPEKSAYPGIIICPRYWGGGAAGNGSLLIGEYAFAGLSLDVLVARAKKENRSSINNILRFGFEQIPSEEFSRYSNLPVDDKHFHFKFARTRWTRNNSIMINANYDLTNLSLFPKPEVLISGTHQGAFASSAQPPSCTGSSCA